MKKLTQRWGKAIALAGAAALALTACGGGDGSAGDDTFEFTLAKGALDGTPHGAVEDAYLDAVEEATDGRVTFDRTEFEALCKMDEVVECVSDGRADIGTTITDYTPHSLPSLSVMSISFLNTDIQAATAALYDIHQDYEPAAQLMEDANLELVTAWPVGTMFLGAKKPIDTFESIDGLRARAAGPVTQQTLEKAGVNVNAITSAESYESLQRGVIDSVAAALDFGVNYKVTEQLPYWVDPGIGQYTAYGMWWNKDAYESLPDDLRDIVDQVTEDFNYGETVETYNEQMEVVCQGMLDSPDVESFTRWDEKETQKWIDVAGDDAEDKWLEIVEGYGFEGGEEFLEEYKATYDALVSDDNPEDAAPACVDRWQDQHN